MRAPRLASCMAENTDELCRGMASLAAQRLGIATEYIEDLPWQERARMVHEGAIQVSWICGLWYILQGSGWGSEIELLAAPVFRGGRYKNQPVYYSDIVVRSDSRFFSFQDLRGASFAYNEPYSHSGCSMVRAHLFNLGGTAGYFGRVVESGGHLTSLKMILNGEVDASAIGSSVPEWERRRRPALSRRIRVIGTLGPSPVPPWVVSRRVPEEMRRELRTLLLSLDREKEGRALLNRGHVARFTQVFDQDYDPIRLAASRADTVSFVTMQGNPAETRVRALH